jgi:hypothetical protein
MSTTLNPVVHRDPEAAGHPNGSVTPDGRRQHRGCQRMRKIETCETQFLPQPLRNKARYAYKSEPDSRSASLVSHRLGPKSFPRAALPKTGQCRPPPRGIII